MEYFLKDSKVAAVLSKMSITQLYEQTITDSTDQTVVGWWTCRLAGRGQGGWNLKLDVDRELLKNFCGQANIKPQKAIL